MNEIKVTTELCAEDRKRIDDLLFAMGYLAGQIQQLHIAGPFHEDKDAVQAKEADLPKEDPIADLPEAVLQTEEVLIGEHPVENPFTEEPKEEPKAPTHTKDEVRKLVVTLSANGKKAEARDIVLANGTSITDLPEEAIDTVYNALKALEG